MEFRILIVDDDITICELLAEELQDQGYKTLVAHGGDDAYKIIQKEGVDLVISDIAMQNGDGIKLLEKINNMGLFKPAVVMVSGFSKLSKKELIERGASDFIKKPINFEGLLKTVEQFVNIKKAREKRMAS